MKVPVYTLCFLEPELLDGQQFNEKGIAEVHRVSGGLHSPMEIVQSNTSEQRLDWWDFVCAVIAGDRMLVSCEYRSSRLVQEISEPRFETVVRKAEASVREGLELLIGSLKPYSPPEGPLSLEYFTDLLAGVKLVDNPYSFLKLSEMAYSCHNVTNYPFSEYLAGFEYWSAVDVRGYQDYSSDCLEAVCIYLVHV